MRSRHIKKRATNGVRALAPRRSDYREIEAGVASFKHRRSSE
jgi:hypothetical protein